MWHIEVMQSKHSEEQCEKFQFHFIFSFDNLAVFTFGSSWVNQLRKWVSGFALRNHICGDDSFTDDATQLCLSGDECCTHVTKAEQKTSIKNCDPKQKSISFFLFASPLSSKCDILILQKCIADFFFADFSYLVRNLKLIKVAKIRSVAVTNFENDAFEKTFKIFTTLNFILKSQFFTTIVF